MPRKGTEASVNEHWLSNELKLKKKLINMKMPAFIFQKKLAQANSSLKESGAKGREIGREGLGKEGKRKEERW